MKWLGRFVVVAICAFAANVEAAPITFGGSFSGLNEIPPNASPATGYALVVLDPDANTLLVDVSFTDLIGITRSAHIHCCAPPTANAGVATMVPTFLGFPLGVTSGTYFATFDTTLTSTFNPAFITANGGTAAGAEAALLAGLLTGNAYFNIHTSFIPGGEIRANLEPVPEPATLTLLGLGLTAAVLARRRSVSRRLSGRGNSENAG